MNKNMNIPRLNIKTKTQKSRKSPTIYVSFHIKFKDLEKNTLPIRYEYLHHQDNDEFHKLIREHFHQWDDKNTTIQHVSHVWYWNYLDMKDSFLKGYDRLYVLRTFHPREDYRHFINTLYIMLSRVFYTLPWYIDYYDIDVLMY